MKRSLRSALRRMVDARVAPDAGKELGRSLGARC